MAAQDENTGKLATVLGIEDFRPKFAWKTYEKLGEGSSALGVFKASDNCSGKKYAVKIFKIRPDFVDDALQGTTPTTDSTVLGYVREFQQILKRKHDNIVKYFFADVRSVADRNSQQYQLCIFMERCMGDTLHRDMKKFHQINQTGYKTFDVHQYFVDVVSGLRYLHEPHRIVHRDLRPENLIFAERDKKILKIADYSASVVLQDSVTMPGEVTMSGGPPPQYRAPETVSAQFGQSGRRSDVWSLACILIFMLQGKAPVFPYEVGSSKIVAVSATQVREALAQGARPDIEGDFNRKTYLNKYRDEEAFLNLARQLLEECLITSSEKRPYMDAVCDHPFISFQVQRTGSWL